MKRKLKPKSIPNVNVPPAALIEQIGEERYTYIVNHRGKQKRTAIARKVGLTKYDLNAIYIILDTEGEKSA